MRLAIRTPWAAVKLLIGILLAWQLVGCVADRFIPIHSATAELPGARGQVTYDLYALPGPHAEYRRVLRFSGSGGSASIEPLEDTGGLTRMSLYTTPGNHIVVLGNIGEDFYFDAKAGVVRPLGTRVDEPLTYMGAFDFVRKQTGSSRELRLIAPSEQPECIATRADWVKPGPNRSEAYRVTCPQLTASLPD